MTAADFLPARQTLAAMRSAAQNCQGCELFRRATQVVFGAGPSSAALVLVGEVPGDQEDKQGKPFVGPAGKLLNDALAAAGIARQDVYMTNAVKHFKWEPRGKRRLHAKPKWREVTACRPWLESELRIIKPQVIVCLGATASQALLGHAFRITTQRGKKLDSSWAPCVIATWHPSAVLRAPDEAARHKLRNELFRDVKLAGRSLSLSGVA
jgi:DNA polymerase